MNDVERAYATENILALIIRDMRTISLPHLNWSEVDVDDRNIIVGRWRKLIDETLKNPIDF